MAVTRQIRARAIGALLAIVISLGISAPSFSAVLPEDRSDVMYHQYNGGGVTIDGPSVLVRKGFKDKISVWGNYYTDSISGASIDLLSRGSNFYQEFREEKSIGFDYLHNRTTLSLSATNSEERDYSANNVAFAVSQDFFGDMTTLSMNYSQSNNEVRRNLYEDDALVDTEDVGDARSQRFGIGLTQVLTRKWIVALNVESVIDDGYLNNPYRDVRFLTPEGINWQGEVYPETRNSDALAVKSMYYLPWKASLKLEYRTFGDSWGIRADSYELLYTQQIKQRLIVQAKYRNYNQTAADFFSDLFPFESAQNFLARDKELSEFSSVALGLGATYELKYDFLNWFDSTTINFYIDNINFDYKNFREALPEITEQVGAGNEPFFKLQSNVVRFFISFKY